MEAVIIYSKSSCQPCRLTKKALERAGVPYSEVSLDSHPTVAEELAAQGHRSAPVVVTPLGTWSGFQPSKLALLA